MLLPAVPDPSTRPTARTPDPSPFARVLVSASRASDLTDAEDIYAPLLGAWDVDSRDVVPDGSVVTGRGEWIFARVLDGRAIQDVLIIPSRTPRTRGRYGTSIRTLNPTTRAWQVAWLNPVAGSFDVLQARRDGDRIVQEGTRPDGQRIRWVFDVITPERFHWYGEAEQADGRWVLETELAGSRKTGEGG